MDKENVALIQSATLFSHRKDEILSFEITWMDLKDILLSEISKTQKEKYHLISLVWGT
jgi:hypothetical protein